MLGYSDYEWMMRDSDLKSLRDEQGFKLLVKKLTSFSEKKQNDSENA
jgi:hypothetical protein